MTVLPDRPGGLDLQASASFNDAVLVRPLVVTRFANTGPGVAVLIIGLVLAVGVSAPVEASLVGWALAAVGVVLAVRGFRTGVRVDGQSVTVYGYLRSRTIPRHSIVEMTYFPALRWMSHSGRSRWTPLVMFMTSSRALAYINAHHEHCQRLLRQKLVSRRSS